MRGEAAHEGGVAERCAWIEHALLGTPEDLVNVLARLLVLHRALQHVLNVLRGSEPRETRATQEGSARGSGEAGARRIGP